MSPEIQSTPNRQITLSPRTDPKLKKQEHSQSPFKIFPQNIFKSIITIKKNNDELTQKNQKIRSLQTKNSHLEEQLAQYQQQKNALENTLKERVEMYKRILKEKQDKSHRNLESIQQQFRLEIKQINQEKEEEERFFSQQTQIMNQKLQLLQNQNQELQQKVTKQLNLHSDQSSEIQKLKMENLALKNQYELMLNEKGTQINKLQANIVKMSEQFKNQKQTLKHETQQQAKQLTTEIKTLQQRLQTQLRALQSLRKSEITFRDNEIAELKRVLETERLKSAHALQAERLRNDHILQTESLKLQKLQNDENGKTIQSLNSKQAIIDAQERDLSQMQRQLSQAAEQNSTLKEQIKELKAQLGMTQRDIVECSQLFAKEKNHLISVIDELRDQLKLNQLNYVHQKNINLAVNGENLRLHQATSDRELLLTEIAELRHLLMESSKQIEICRERFITIERENKSLMFEVERVGAENGALLRVRRDLEEEAVKWRHNYLRVAR